MFLEKSFAQRRVEPSVRGKGVAIFLIAMFAFLLIGCPNDNVSYDELWTAENSKFTLAGTWKTEYDGYIINLSESSLEYDDGGWGTGYIGTIEEIRKFNNDGTVGVILIKYTEKPIDFNTGKPPTGYYIGIYFRNLTSAQGDFTTASASDDLIPAKTTLQVAKNTFTEGSMGKYTAFWSTCTKE